MKISPALALAALLAATPALAAEPVRIGVTTILSGPMADRGQSEQYGVELALARINEAGGVLGRPVEAFYGDNAADVKTGVAATKRLIEEQHVPVLLGALATPVTHAIMPIAQAAKVPLVIDISAGQDFVDASGVGGNDWTFKTIPSDRDIAIGMISWLKRQGINSVAIAADDNDFNRTNAASMAKAAEDAGIKTLANETIAKDAKDLAPLMARFKDLAPDAVLTVLSNSSASFFRAYEQSGWNVPVVGRLDFKTALDTLSPSFVNSGGLAKAAGIAVFTPLLDKPGVKDFVAAYRAKYGIMPTQRSFFAFEFDAAGGRRDPARGLRQAGGHSEGAQEFAHGLRARRDLRDGRPQPPAHADADPRRARRQGRGDRRSGRLIAPYDFGGTIAQSWSCKSSEWPPAVSSAWSASRMKPGLPSKAAPTAMIVQSPISSRAPGIPSASSRNGEASARSAESSRRAQYFRPCNASVIGRQVASNEGRSAPSAAATSGRMQSTWICNWSWLRENIELMERPTSSRGTGRPRCASSAARPVQASAK